MGAAISSAVTSRRRLPDPGEAVRVGHDVASGALRSALRAEAYDTSESLESWTGFAGGAKNGVDTTASA